MSDMQQGSATIETYPFDPLAASVHDWAKLHAYRRTRGEEDYPGEPLLPDAEFEHVLRQHWTDAAIIVQYSRTKTCIVTRPRTSPGPMPSSLAG